MRFRILGKSSARLRHAVAEVDLFRQTCPPAAGRGTLAKNVEILPGFLPEMLGTFMLVFTVLNVTAG